MREEQLWGWVVCRGRVGVKDRGLDNLAKDWVRFAVLMLMSLVWGSTIVLGAEHIQDAAGM
jgi:CubicO group peptidase (beta-lactamase class C family)